MTSFQGPYVGIFGREIDDQNTINQIEIPLIQRDYAQGRETPEVDLIRSDFLGVLTNAISNGPPVGLDFVYGDVKNGVLRPLDGQQRLTTLFLLHWYLATRIDALGPDLAWTKFDYATRSSARLFCERIVKYPAPAATTDLADWIADQAWFQYLWRHDPTIQSMLTMIGAIEAKFSSIDHFNPKAAWDNLTNLVDPAVWFHVLPIEEAGQGDNLYIKMNSRGRPLTRFENFKARFEQAIEGSPRSKEFSTKIDGPWSDMFWPFRDEENKTDKQFERIFLFITETLEWRAGGTQTERLEDRAERIFAPTVDPDGTNLNFLISILDAWTEVKDIGKYFAALFKRSGNDQAGEAVTLFGGRQTINLFKACADSYETPVNTTQRTFGWAETLLLYAVQIHLINETSDFLRRLRTLRNLTENSTNELRLSAMPDLLSSVERFVLAASFEEALAELNTFNSAQIEDEKEKARFLTVHPELESAVFRLEDETILRGSLVSFELDAESFATRAMAFSKIMTDSENWCALTGALLACGNYSRTRGNRFIRFGSGSETRSWRELLTGGTRSAFGSTAAPLGTLLDRLNVSGDPTVDVLREMSAQWLDSQQAFDWRYYLVRYDVMRSGVSGIYTGQDGRMGYQLCMLDRTQMNSWYRDPYLSAIADHAQVGASLNPLLFTGYETEERWMQLTASGTRLRCDPNGFIIAPPPSPDHQAKLSSILDRWEIGEDFLLQVRQSDGIDVDNRIEVCAKFITELSDAGL